MVFHRALWPLVESKYAEYYVPGSIFRKRQRNKGGRLAPASVTKPPHKAQETGHAATLSHARRPTFHWQALRFEDTVLPSGKFQRELERASLIYRLTTIYPRCGILVGRAFPLDPGPKLCVP